MKCSFIINNIRDGLLNLTLKITDDDVRFEDRDQAGRARPMPRGGHKVWRGRGGSRIPVADMRRTNITNFTWYKVNTLVFHYSSQKKY